LVYALLDVLLLTSTMEGTPNVLIEAQATGRPVVATDVGGTREAVKDGVTGILVRERSAGKLADAVLRILEDPSWPARARVSGPAWVSERFGLDRMIEETLAAYAMPAEAANAGAVTRAQSAG
jgi:glycosyltransferase involved in cell wall biosynthesis